VIGDWSGRVGSVLRREAQKDFSPAAAHSRQHKRPRNREGARREGVLEANGVFSRLIGEGSGLREQSGGCRTRTRSLPSLVRRLPDELASPRFGYTSDQRCKLDRIVGWFNARSADQASVAPFSANRSFCCKPRPRRLSLGQNLSALRASKSSLGARPITNHQSTSHFPNCAAR
jgi:hypothetical protein